MELKFKENIDVNSFTFKKRVIEEGMSLLEYKRNYLSNDINFVCMIAFINNLVENDLIIETLSNGDKIEEKMYTIVEPIFKEKVLSNEEYLDSYRIIVQNIKEYLDREHTIHSNIAGVLFDFIDLFGEVDTKALTDTLTMAMSAFEKKANVKEKPKKTDEQIKEDVLKDIDNMKMKALIEKYKKQEAAE